MSFDAGQFFNKLFNTVGNISDTDLSRTGKTDGYNFHEEAKMLPDEAPDREIRMLAYAVPEMSLENKPDTIEDKPISVEKYAILRPEPTEENPTPSLNPDKPINVKYGIPNPTPTEESIAMYAVPNPEPSPAPTTPTQAPEPQPVTPQKSENPWRFNFQQIFTNIFSNWKIPFAQRLNNLFSNIFSRWR